MKRWMVVLLTVIGVLVIEAAILLGIMWSGAYNISTNNHDNAVLNWFFDTGSTRAIEAHAKGITVPDLSAAQKMQDGFMHYDEMCVMCHGAPGVEAGEIAKGLWPPAPNLVEAVPGWTPEQVYWITKNGIKFSAMPAWGPTHKEDELWAMVAFMEKLPKMSATEYAAMKKMPGMKE